SLQSEAAPTVGAFTGMVMVWLPLAEPDASEHCTPWPTGAWQVIPLLAVMVPLKLKPVGSVSLMVAAATVGPFVTTAVTIQLNVPPLANVPTRLLLLESARDGLMQLLTVMSSLAVAGLGVVPPPAMVAVLV